MELMTASRQHVTRPADERFTSLHALAAFTSYQKRHSARRTMPNRALTVVPSATDPLDIACCGPNGHPAQFTNWSFQQLCSLAGVPAGYITRSAMPGALAADNINWGLHHHRPVESVSVHLFQDRDAPAGPITFLRSVNGPDFGMVWDADITTTLVQEFGDGVTGDWTVPGIFGHRLDAVTEANTTLYASDRDMWVFLADESRRIDIPARRNNAPGSLARGFYLRNSGVGAGALTLGMFLFDYVCCNRIIWGAQQHQELRIRHTSGAPHRWLEEVKPILQQYANSSPMGVQETIAAARQAKIRGDVADFLATRFGKGLAGQIQAIHQLEESRPIETTWDAVVGATAYARQLVHVDSRVAVERQAGELLSLGRRALPLAIAGADLGL